VVDKLSLNNSLSKGKFDHPLVISVVSVTIICVCLWCCLSPHMKCRLSSLKGQH